MTNIARVLVVDDSAYVRKVVKQMLQRSPFIEVVGAARDGVEALEMVAELRPDVVTCDLNMPQMDGVAFVRAQMAIKPVPIIIISIASQSGEQVLAADLILLEVHFLTRVVDVGLLFGYGDVLDDPLARR